MTGPLRPPNAADGPRPDAAAGIRPDPAKEARPSAPRPPAATDDQATNDKAAVVKAATGHGEPPPGRQFPCRRCGAKLNYDPSASALVCPYCGYTEQIEPQAGQIEEHDLEEYLKRQAGEETVLAGRSSEVKCGSCGAIVLLEDNVAMDRCPYCAAVLSNHPVAAEAMIPPESVLPFRVSQRDAVQAFSQWVENLWFAPSTLKQMANLGQLSGVYVPFWTYDSMTYTQYTGSRGVDYTTQETYMVSNAQGQTEMRTRAVVRTAWYPAAGMVKHFFDDVLVYASASLPRTNIDQLEPWDLSDLEPFNPGFLAGFKTERYTVGLVDGFQIAQQEMDEAIRQLCCQDIGGDHQMLDNVQTQHVGVTFKHLLLPVWLAAYSYQGEPFRILINARTGEVNGTRPYSWVKISLLVVTIAAAVMAIVLATQR